MKEKGISRLTEILLLLLLPYLATMLINGAECALLNYDFSGERILPWLVSSQISTKFDLEAVKCQAVIARTNFYRNWKEKEDFWEVLRDIREITEFTKYEDFFIEDIYKNAAKETRGVVLLYGEEWKQLPYHLCSNGQTRRGPEVLHDQAYQYLQSVNSEIDKQAEYYLSHTYIKEQQLLEKIEILERDSSGYVMSLKVNGSIWEGETFRQEMGLPSPDFYVKQTGNTYYFICKGSGHGVGFSQYGGHMFGKQGKDWKEILQIYFPAMEMKKVSGI